jgi:hypothetical protein
VEKLFGFLVSHNVAPYWLCLNYIRMRQSRRAAASLLLVYSALVQNVVYKAVELLGVQLAGCL